MYLINIFSTCPNIFVFFRSFQMSCLIFNCGVSPNLSTEQLLQRLLPSEDITFSGACPLFNKTCFKQSSTLRFRCFLIKWPVVSSLLTHDVILKAAPFWRTRILPGAQLCNINANPVIRVARFLR